MRELTLNEMTLVAGGTGVEEFDANGVLIRDQAQQALPMLVAQVLPIGLRGIVVAGLLAAEVEPAPSSAPETDPPTRAGVGRNRDQAKVSERVGDDRRGRP